jgi:hypothetical protein
MKDASTHQTLRLLAPFLDQLRLDPSADCFYDSLSGGLLWTDEVPDAAAVPSGTFEALRGVLWYRTALILGEAKKRDLSLRPEMEQTFPNWSGQDSADQAESLWLEAQRLFPNWPGFAPSRRSTEFREKCIELRSKAADEIDRLFDP